MKEIKKEKAFEKKEARKRELKHATEKMAKRIEKK